MMPDAEICSTCNLPALFDPEPACRACGAPETLRAPNVLLAKSQVALVQGRYEAAKQAAEAAGCTDELDRIEVLAENSVPVVNVNVLFALAFLANEKAGYVPYATLVAAGVRPPSNIDDDRTRTVVDAALYGSYGQRINFAALSTDGLGVTSYGDVHLELCPEAIEFRSSVLERNSWHLYEDNARSIPDGHLVVWDLRRMIAAIKAAPKLVPGMTDSELRALLLFQEGNRDTDEILEVHIYGLYTSLAIKTARLPKTFALEEDQLFAEVIRKRAVASVKVESI